MVVYVILMTDMILRYDSYEKSCWKWSKNHSGTTDLSMGNHHGDPRGDPGNIIDKLCSIISHWKCLPM